MLSIFYLKLLLSSVKLNEPSYMTQSLKTQLLKNIPPMHKVTKIFDVATPVKNVIIDCTLVKQSIRKTS